jgi:hypothetical protein
MLENRVLRRIIGPGKREGIGEQGILLAMPWLRRLGFLVARVGQAFLRVLRYSRFWWAEWDRLGQAFLRVLRYSRFSITPLLLYSSSHASVANAVALSN